METEDVSGMHALLALMSHHWDRLLYQLARERTAIGMGIGLQVRCRPATVATTDELLVRAGDALDLEVIKLKN